MFPGFAQSGKTIVGQRDGNSFVVGVMHRHTSPERVDFFLVANKWLNEPRNCEPERCDELAWHPLALLPENTVPYVRRAAGLIAVAGHRCVIYVHKHFDERTQKIASSEQACYPCGQTLVKREKYYRKEDARP